MDQVVRFCAAPDGVRIAYAVHGSGPPLVKVANWLTHLEYDWESPIWRHWLNELGRRFTVVRYDERCCGLSDPDPRELGLDAFVSDLEAVVDAAGLERFALLGISQGGAVALEYARRHPERVEAIAFCGGYSRGRLQRDAPALEEHKARMEVARIGWGNDNDRFRKIFANWMLPDAGAAEIEAFDELQRRSCSAENAVRLLDAWARVDATSAFPGVKARALVCHARGDQAVPISEGELIARSLPDARFVPLDSRNHLLLPHEPAWQEFIRAVDDFFAVAPHRERDDELSAREREVMTLVSRGLGNDEIADELVLSVRTVERHLSNVYVKWGLTGRAARAAAAARFSSSRTT
jgi:pimeloyl-ACP methyl ester carboxylesterase/DNA-binding CsgD family transcriptional regulator